MQEIERILICHPEITDFYIRARLTIVRYSFVFFDGTCFEEEVSGDVFFAKTLRDWEDTVSTAMMVCQIKKVA